MKINLRIHENKFINDYKNDIVSKEEITSGHLKDTTKYIYKTPDRDNNIVYFNSCGFLVEHNGKAIRLSMLQSIKTFEAEGGSYNG